MENQATLNNTLSSSFDHLPAFKRWLMKSLAKIRCGKLLVHMDGETFVCGNDDSITAQLHIHHPLKMAWRCIRKGDLGFAESYLEGDWSSEDVTKLLKLFLKNRGNLGSTYGCINLLRSTTNLYHRLRRNSLSGSRKNIEYHYDLGNEFYKLWLDKSMTYSSALFAHDPDQNIVNKDLSLVEAQNLKYQRIIDELQSSKGETILEVGCGWGGFAEKAVENGNILHGITLSHEQLQYSKNRLVEHNDSTSLEIRDYRTINDKYNHIVSIEMFEAVGEEYWQTYFEMLNRSLKPGGKIVLQIITIKDEFYDLYQRRADFIQRYIFPGGMLPSEGILNDLVKSNNLKITNKMSFGHHYGETLARWEDNFLTATPEVDSLGYDERFKRMWRYYLGYCQAGFEEERIDVIQLTLTHS